MKKMYFDTELMYVWLWGVAKVAVSPLTEHRTEDKKNVVLR